MLYYVWDCLKFVQKLFQYNSQNLFRFVTVVLGMTDIIKRVWILSAFLWNPPGYTCVVFVVFLIWLEWAETLDFPCLSLGFIWLAKSKCQANYFDVVLKFMQSRGGGRGGQKIFLVSQ